MIDLQTGNIMIYPDLILHSNLTFLEFKKTGKLQVQVSHPDKPVSACCN
jgi:hypothetical protein